MSSSGYVILITTVVAIWTVRNVNQFHECCNKFMAAKCMKKQITSDDWLNGKHVVNDIGFSATWKVVHEDVCTYIRALGNVRTGKYQQKNLIYTVGWPDREYFHRSYVYTVWGYTLHVWLATFHGTAKISTLKSQDRVHSSSKILYGSVMNFQSLLCHVCEATLNALEIRLTTDIRRKTIRKFFSEQ